MQGYLTIGEFAKLHNVNQKSLRYYERIGALVPAWTDPSTGYRYYALEQLIEMDMILMCLELDIPLKEAQQYRNADHTLDIRHLLQDGQQKALEKMGRLQEILAQMEDALRRVEEGETCQGQAGTYRRHLGCRLILREPFDPSGGELGFKQGGRPDFSAWAVPGAAAGFHLSHRIDCREEGGEDRNRYFSGGPPAKSGGHLVGHPAGRGVPVPAEVRPGAGPYRTADGGLFFPAPRCPVPSDHQCDLCPLRSPGT